jgi:ribonuclease HIII
MDKTYLKNLIDFLEKEYYLTDQIKEIGYGVQFYVSKNGSKDLIRVYQNNKGKITLDPSQIKTPTLREYLADFSPASTETKTAVLLAPPLIGTDEAGKGDYFAPLCVAGVYADERQYRKLITCGVRDSKQLTDEKILALAKEVQNICPVYSVIAISNQRFNELYTKTPNMNALLGWAHAQAIKNIRQKISCNRILVDRFGNERWIQMHFDETDLHFVFETKAERNAAVAAASILAREAMIQHLDKLKKQYDFDFPLGASAAVDAYGKEFVAKFSAEELKNIAKINFKNTGRILS